jgi:hypothetical protein
MTVESVIDYIKIDPYQVLRKNINDKKNSLLFLPKCLEEVSKSKNFYWNGQKLKSSYLVDRVHNLILKFYFKKENKFHLHSTILKEKYGYLYNYYISWLENKGLLILMFNHQKGKNSRIYSLQSGIFSSQILRFNNPDRVLLKKFKAKVCQIETPQEDKNLIEKDIRIKLVNDLYGVQIQFDRAIFFLGTLLATGRTTFSSPVVTRQQCRYLIAKLMFRVQRRT